MLRGKHATSGEKHLYTQPTGCFSVCNVGRRMQQYLLGHYWFQIKWPDSWQEINIATKELLPILVASAVWGREWSSLSICCWCDNAAIVSVINTGWCRDKHLMHLMRCLFFYAARFCFCLSARHIAGAANLRADALSQNKMSNFFSIFPQANPTPRSSTTIPTGASNGQQPGLDITSLEGSVLQL